MRRTRDEVQLWAEHARLVLVGRAAQQRTITYTELENAVSERLDIEPRRNWFRVIGADLLRVAKLNKWHEEPLLGAIVVNSHTGVVGEGYAGGFARRYGYTPTVPLDEHAQVERARVFAHFADPSFLALTGEIR